MITIENYLKARRTIAEYEQQLNKPAVVSRYLKMAISSFGKFSNDNYDIVGIM
jgi:hypothetical protein